MKNIVAFKILDMHCTACAMNIDGKLEDTKGVTKSQTNYAQQKTEVEFDSTLVTETTLIEIIQKAGYRAIKA